LVPRERTAEQKAELQELESRLPAIVESLLGVQKDFGIHLNGDLGETKDIVTDSSPTKKEDSEVPDLSEDIEDLKKIQTKTSDDAVASASSS
jgi:hypothetical protein